MTEQNTKLHGVNSDKLPTVEPRLPVPKNKKTKTLLTYVLCLAEELWVFRDILFLSAPVPLFPLTISHDNTSANMESYNPTRTQLCDTTEKPTLLFVCSQQVVFIQQP